MSLIDDLRAVENFATSHQPVVSELGPIVGALIAYVEHGDQLLEAARADVEAREAGEPANRVNELLSPAPEPEPEPAAPSAPAAAPDVGLEAENASLRQQLANLQAQQGRTEVVTEPLNPATETEPVPPGPTPPGSSL